MHQPTLDVLLDRGILQVGDQLICNQQRVIDETVVRAAMIESADVESGFWKCRITQQTKETHEVRYCVDEQYYGLARLATRIAEHFTNGTTPISITNPDTIWCHPEFDDRTLWDLRIANMK